jgi:hypothetical protein
MQEGDEQENHTAFNIFLWILKISIPIQTNLSSKVG